MNIADLTLGKKIYIFAKGLNGEFLFCNENLAEFTGLDSPSQAIGKTDHELLWRATAEACRESDILTMRGKQFCNIPEKLVRFDGQKKIEHEIVMSKFQLLNKDNHCIGVLGSFVDNDANLLIKPKTHKSSKISSRIFLGNGFGDIYLTRVEYVIFRQIILGMSSKQIAINLSISPRTVESHIENLKGKLDCKYKSEIPIIAIQNGWIF